MMSLRRDVSQVRMHIFRRKVISIIRVKLIMPHLRSALVIMLPMSLLGDITVQFPGGKAGRGPGCSVHDCSSTVIIQLVGVGVFFLPKRRRRSAIHAAQQLFNVYTR